MKNFIHFIRYDNIVPITLGILFLGAGGAYAAANPESIYSESQQVVAIDNTYIAAKDFDSYTPRVQIVSVTEDAENYYVTYRFTTIDLREAVWQDIVKEEMMTVSKEDLGPYRDLGLFVAEQLRQKVGRELQRLRDTQTFERRKVTQKTVATAYAGLVGRFLDDTTDVLPGYVPVVTPPEGQVAVFTEPTPFPVATEPPPRPEPREPQVDEPRETEVYEEPPAPSTTGLTLQMLGDNPARVEVGGSYTDLGVVASNDANEDIAVQVFVNGALVGNVAIDTSAAGTWTIKYVAEDAGGIIEVTRKVEVYSNEPEPPTEPPETVPEPEPEPEPAPKPKPKPEPPAEEVGEEASEEQPTPEGGNNE